MFDAWKRRVILREGLSSNTAQLKTIIKDCLEGPANLECHQRLLIWSSHYLQLHTVLTWSWQLFCWLVCCLGGIVVWESCYDYGTQSQTKYLTDPGMNFNLCCLESTSKNAVLPSPWPRRPWILWCIHVSHVVNYLLRKGVRCLHLDLLCECRWVIELEDHQFSPNPQER